jgi:YD repeat-containing protein
VTQRTRPGPEITYSEYDRAGRLTTIEYPSSTSTVTIGYDGAGRRTLLSNAKATATLHFDNAGRLDTVTQSITGGPVDLVTSYTYDALDRLETMTYPSGQVLTYGWDNRNWLTSLTGEDGSAVEYLHALTYHASHRCQA